MNLQIPPPVNAVVSRLRRAGYRAVLVGGCVRDLLRGVLPHDWDVASSALPEEIKAVFLGERLIETGLKHGTLTVLLDPLAIEITTFRADGTYSDGRRPDAVRFSRSLSEDLSRRDFTINALCIDQDGQIIDHFGGQQDLDNRVIRCIGDPDRRFEEDALRLLRALRFAASMGFSIEPATAGALSRHLHRLRLLSAERVLSELQGLLPAPDVKRVLLEYPDVLFALLPPLQALNGLAQSPCFHCFDGYRHTVCAVAAVAPIFSLRLTMLLHDIGKPLCDDEGKQFQGHDKAGALCADSLLQSLRCSSSLRHQVVRLIRLHQLPLSPERFALRELLATYGEVTLRDLLAVQRADASAHTPSDAARRLCALDQFEAAFEALLKERPALILGALAVNGVDLLGLGIPKGETIGTVLRFLLQEVISERLPNDKTVLLDAAKGRFLS